MRNDNMIPFAYQRYAMKIPSIYARYTNKMTTNTLSELYATVLVLSKLKKVNATAPQRQCNVLENFALFKNVAHNLEPGETPTYTASYQAQNYVQRS